jgi:hypothetical protein
LKARKTPEVRRAFSAICETAAVLSHLRYRRIFFTSAKFFLQPASTTGPMKTGHHRPRPFFFESRKNFEFERDGAQIDTA